MSEEQKLSIVPDGYRLVKVGGRPKKEARDAAVFLAKFWRKEAHHESSAVAEEWIVDAWAFRGIGETAHVRAAIKRSRNRGLNHALLIRENETGVCTAVEAEKNECRLGVTDGARGWVWANGMTEAIEVRIREPQITIHQEVFLKSPINQAMRHLKHR